jgi:hypothetical protein
VHLRTGSPASALISLTALRGVGPATASAILALQAPAEQAFMSDEAVAILAPAQAGKYTPAAWRAFANAVERRLASWPDEGGAVSLERACYALIAGQRLGAGGHGRGGAAPGDSDEAGETPRHRKRQKR